MRYSRGRRVFLSRVATATAGAVAHHFASQEPRPRADLGEGIYTDRFTYRRGDPVLVHAGLERGQWIDLDLIRHDLAISTRYDRVSTWVGMAPMTGEPGVESAGFPVVRSLDTTDLPEGIYDVRIPPESMRPENRTSSEHQYPSFNYTARFVVTSAVPGAHSRILWIHDGLTGVAYGSFGGKSIYGNDDVRVRSVSYDRPGQTRSTEFYQALRLFLQDGYSFEYIDVIALADADPGFLSTYDLVVMVGQFEYIPHSVMAHLQAFVDDGGNVFASTWEFSAFRTRLDHASKQMTVYKYDYETEDPLYGSGSPLTSGVAMNLTSTIRETELLGQTVWAAHAVTGATWIDLPLYNTDLVQPLLAGTGLGPGSVLPAAFRGYGLGNRLTFQDDRPVIVDPEFSGTPTDTVIWAAVPSAFARVWWQNDGDPSGAWPLLDDGYAVATFQDRPSGSRIVSLPSSHLAKSHTSEPLYQQLLLNILGFLAG